MLHLCFNYKMPWNWNNFDHWNRKTNLGCMYNHNDLFTLWCDFDERTKWSHKLIENNLRLLRTWGLQLSGECNGQDCLHLNLFSTRQVYPALFLFLNVESVPLPRKEDNPSFTSLSRITEMMIRLAVSTLFGYKYLIFFYY